MELWFVGCLKKDRTLRELIVVIPNEIHNIHQRVTSFNEIPELFEPEWFREELLQMGMSEEVIDAYQKEHKKLSIVNVCDIYFGSLHKCVS